MNSFRQWACLYHVQTFLIGVASYFVDVNGHSPQIGGFCLGSLGMALENGSTRHCSCIMLAEGDDAPLEPAEVSKEEPPSISIECAWALGGLNIHSHDEPTFCLFLSHFIGSWFHRYMISI